MLSYLAMGIYRIRYEIGIPVPDLTGPPGDRHLAAESIFDEGEVELDAAYEKWLLRVRIAVALLAVLGALVPLYVDRTAQSSPKIFPLYASIMIVIACGIAYWTLFSWLLNAFYLKPRLAGMLPKKVLEQGLVRVIAFSRIA